MMAPRTRWWAAAEGWAAWRDDPLRRAVNEAGAHADRVGNQLMATLFPLLLIFKTWLREGMPGLALLASTHALLAAALAFLAGHRGWGRRFYVAHREPLLLLYCLHMQWTVRLTACESSVNTIDHHGGSSWALLLLLLGHTTALYSALCALYARLVLPASAAVLAVLAATSLAAGPRMCARVLESPGVEAPLAELHKVFHLLLGGGLPPGAASLLGQLSASPMEQCLGINAFLAVAVGAAAPFLLLRLLHLRAAAARAAAAARQRRLQQQETADGEESEEEKARRRELEEQKRSPDGCARSLALGYCALGATWAVACSLAAGNS